MCAYTNCKVIVCVSEEKHISAAEAVFAESTGTQKLGETLIDDDTLMAMLYDYLTACNDDFQRQSSF